MFVPLHMTVSFLLRRNSENYLHIKVSPFQIVQIYQLFTFSKIYERRANFYTKTETKNIDQKKK